MARSPEHAGIPGFLCAALLVLLGACSDPAAEKHQQELTAMKAAVEAGDHSSALRLARSALNEHPDDPEARLGAAVACIGLKRYTEAAEHAAAGLAASPDDPTLVADLHWAQAAGHFALYLELKTDDDWRAANSSYERGTAAAGTHRADAAYALARMQGLGGMGSDGRRNKFGRLFLELEPDGERADKVREIMGGEGTH